MAPGRPAIEEVSEVSVIVQRDERVLLAQCPDGGRWAGMWEFPRRPLADNQGHEETAQTLLKDVGVLRPIWERK